MSDHHDKAYDWAARRKLETHPTTGAAQLVEVRETVQQVIVPVYVQTELPAVPRPGAASPSCCLFGRMMPSCWAMACQQNGWPT
jgi:hypothetical protein